MKVEKKLQDKIVDFLKNNNIWHFRYTASTTFGIPDILALYDGYLIGIEVKREDGKGSSTLLQEEVIKSMKDNGGLGAVVESLNEVVTLFKSLDLEDKLQRELSEQDYEMREETMKRWSM